jgi:hypothetical protein
MPRHPLRDNLHGFFDDKDRLWRITGPNFVAGLTEYNDELTGYAPILAGVFGAKVIHYGGNAYFILNEARKRCYKVEHVEDRRNPEK